MSSRSAPFVLAMGLCAASASAASAAVSVQLDQSTSVSLGGQASQVAVGNPAVADVSLIDRRHIMILGRAYGMTNLTVFDQAGRRIYETTVTVGSTGDSGRVSLFRGAEVQNYTCGPRCERTPLPGESTPVYQNASGAYTDYAARAKAAANSGNP